MIEFYGEPSEESKMSIHKINDKIMFFFYLLLDLVFLTIAVIGLIFNEGALVVSGFIGFIGCVITTILIKFIRPAKSVLKIGSIDKFIFDDVSVTFIQKYGWSEEKKVKPISKVRKVVDEGGWYHIMFKGMIDNCWICQKDLITKGTIEDFEKLFEGKIRRRNTGGHQTGG